MTKTLWKPGTMIYPVPAVLVSCGTHEDGLNIITIAWTGTVCSEPPLCYISVRPETVFTRHYQQAQRIRHQPHHGAPGARHGLVRRKVGPRCRQVQGNEADA